MELDNLVFQYGEIEKLADMDTVIATDPKSTEMETFQKVTIPPSQKYKKYGQGQIERFIRLIQEEGLTVPKSAEQCGIPCSAYKLLNEFNAGCGAVLSGTVQKQVKRSPNKLFPEHTAFLIDLFGTNSSLTLEEAKQNLSEHFDGLQVSLSGFYKHIREECAISLKQATKYTLEQDTPRTIELRYNIVSQWKAAGVNFRDNCVFVDEAGFNSQLMRGRAWSKVGEPAIVKAHTQKGVNVSIVGCIFPFGTICFSKVEPLKKAGSRANPKPIQLKKGVTAYHIVKFMESVMDILNKHNKKGRQL